MSTHSKGSSVDIPITKFVALPLGAIKPDGWMLDQCRIQANGLSGHLEEFWPDIARSKWIGGEAEGWERGPYWLDGIVPLAFLIDDPNLQSRAACWIDYILEHQHPDGWLGQKEEPRAGSSETAPDPWPMFVLFKALRQWEEATGDIRVLPAIQKALRSIDAHLHERSLQSWAKMRWPDLVHSILWFYKRNGGGTENAWLLEFARKVEGQGYDWRGHFEDFRLCEKQSAWTLENHVVNHAMALKEPLVRSSFWDAAEKDAPSTEDAGAGAARYLTILDECHGQVTGVFSGDECLAGKCPSQGTELCAVVESLFSLELLIETYGEPAFADRLERIAFNALPAAFTPDMWAHQYDQQANQVLVNVAPRDWVSNGPDANLFGLEPFFGCCTANFHQGWPKLVSHSWMASRDGGLAAIMLVPSTVSTQICGVAVSIKEVTQYPFREEVRFIVQVSQPVSFPFHVRIPVWAHDATIHIENEDVQNEDVQKAVAGGFHVIEREWRNGETVMLRVPMKVRLEQRFNHSLSVLRGPLVFALRIGEEFRHLRGELPHADWEVHPTTPWNYGLEASSLLSGVEVVEQEVGRVPFDPQNPPVTLKVPAQRVPQWTMQNNSAAPPPTPLTSSEVVERVELIPYGSCHLRVSEFPQLQLPTNTSIASTKDH